MKYRHYNTFFNYLVSDLSNGDPYKEVKLYLTNTDDPSLFRPSNNLYVTMEDCDKYFINAGTDISGLKSQEGVLNQNTLLSKSVTTDDDPLGDAGPDNYYESMLNEPAWMNGQKCPFIQSYKGRARNEALINGEPRLSDIEAIKRSFAWKQEYDEGEYRKYSIPLTPLNKDTVCMGAENVTVSAREKFAANGALLAAKQADKLFPIGFVAFENPSYYNQYVFNWNPNGIFRVK